MEHAHAAVRHEQSVRGDDAVLRGELADDEASDERASGEVQEEPPTSNERRTTADRSPRAESHQKAGLGRLRERKDELPAGFHDRAGARSPPLRRVLKNITFQKRATRSWRSARPFLGRVIHCAMIRSTVRVVMAPSMTSSSARSRFVLARCSYGCRRR